MKLTLIRKYIKEEYTIGELMYGNLKLCDTLEPKDRGLDCKMSLEEIKSKKVSGSTAIPTGTYRVSMDIISPKFCNRNAYKFCEGKLPRLNNVPGFNGILIHIGNWKEDTAGCILVGRNVVKGGILYSTQTFHSLYLLMAETKGEIWIEVKG